MSKCRANGGFAECETCLNREFDPFQCESCDDASNYEPQDGDDDGLESSDMSYADFLTWMKVAA